jgi:hypothetical protein
MAEIGSDSEESALRALRAPTNIFMRKLSEE